MASRPAGKVSPIELGVASLALNDQTESGDLHVARLHSDGILLAVIDGIGHGQSAAVAAKAAAAILERLPEEPLVSLAEHCHDELRTTRGVVISIASINFRRCVLTWLGIGNVQGVILRGPSGKALANDILMLRAGVVGAQLPILQTTTVPFCPGDTLIFATDGIRSDFLEDLSLHGSSQKCADTILSRHSKSNDDALVLVARTPGLTQ